MSPTGATGAPRVLIVGTSLTAGYGLDPSRSYPAVLQQLADSAGLTVRIDAAGVSGETSAGALRRIDWLLRERADVVVVETGANDGLRAFKPSSTKENLEGIVAAIRRLQPEAQVLIAAMEAPPNFGQRYTGEFRALFPDVARERGATLIPFFLDGVAGIDSLNQQDGIHPNRRGAIRAAQNMWRTLGPAVAAIPAISAKARR